MKDLSFNGLWWLPTAEIKVGGTFSFSNLEGIHLSLIGSLGTPPDIHGEENYPIILGLSDHGRPVTLTNCAKTGSRISGSGFISQKYMANMAYIGTHFNNLDDTRFYKMHVQYSHLLDWVASTLTPQFPEKNEKGLIEYKVVFKPPAHLKATLDGFGVSIFASTDWGGSWDREVRFTQSAWLVVESEQEMAFDNLTKRFIYPFQNLVTLATARPNSVTEISVYAKEKNLRQPDGELLEAPIQVLFQTVYSQSQPDKRIVTPHLLFELDDIAGDFEAFISRWLNIASDLDSVCNLFFSAQYSPIMYLEHQFLILAQAAESYHRRRVGNQVLSEELHNKKIQEIVNQVADEHRPWLKEKLRYSNEPSLRQRMRELLQLVGEAVLPLVQNPKSFVQQVYVTRNYLTHYDLTLQNRAARGRDLYRLTQVLFFLLQACFLHELGFSPEQRAVLFARNSRWQALSRNP